MKLRFSIALLPVLSLCVFAQDKNDSKMNLIALEPCEAAGAASAVRISTKTARTGEIIVKYDKLKLVAHTAPRPTN